MPWSVVENHPDCDGWAVVKDDDGTVEGCHATEGDAQAQLAALNASEENMMPTGQHLTRTVDFTVVRADDSADGLTLEGYAAVFNSPTRIDSWEGTFDEVISPGAFKRTIDRKGPGGIRLQFDHGSHPLIGSIPIGAIRELREDARGLWVSARLHDNWLTEPVRQAIDEGSIHGMSFRFRVVDDDGFDPNSDDVRTIREVELFEVGPVVWPAYEDTSVGVRTRQIAQQLAQDKDFRRELLRALASDGTSDTPDGSPVEEPATPDGSADEAPRRNRSDDHKKAVAYIDRFLEGSRKKSA